MDYLDFVINFTKEHKNQNALFINDTNRYDTNDYEVTVFDRFRDSVEIGVRDHESYLLFKFTKFDEQYMPSDELRQDFTVFGLDACRIIFLDFMEMQGEVSHLFEFAYTVTNRHFFAILFNEKFLYSRLNEIPNLLDGGHFIKTEEHQFDCESYVTYQNANELS